MVIKSFIFFGLIVIGLHLCAADRMAEGEGHEDLIGAWVSPVDASSKAIAVIQEKRFTLQFHTIPGSETQRIDGVLTRIRNGELVIDDLEPSLPFELIQKDGQQRLHIMIQDDAAGDSHPQARVKLVLVRWLPAPS